MRQLGRRQPFLSFPLFVADGRSGYVLVLIWFSLQTSFYFLFFVHFCIKGRLSIDRLWYIHDWGCGRQGMGGLSAPCQLVFFSSFFGW